MATWEDGPEYAPIQPPDRFADPPAAALESVPAEVQQAALAPKERPEFTDPPAPVVPLETLIPPIEVQRDPTAPFEVVASTMTEDSSAWSAAHWSPPVAAPHEPAWPPQGQGSWPVPHATAPPAPTPAAIQAPPAPQPLTAPPPLATTSGPWSPVNGYPAPGTEQWFAPTPYASPVPPRPPPGAKELIMAATPGVLLPLLVGGLIYPLAPVLLALAAILSGRMRVARNRVRPILWGSLGFVGFVAAVSLLYSADSFTDWWRTIGIWSLVVCWAMLVVILVAVYRELRAAAGRSGPGRSTWA